MNVIEAIKQGIEALEEACGDRCNAEYNPCYARTAITSLRQAIADLEEQEPKREWVGLTDEEMVELFEKCYKMSALLDAHEAKLKEKNT